MIINGFTRVLFFFFHVTTEWRSNRLPWIGLGHKDLLVLLLLAILQGRAIWLVFFITGGVAFIFRVARSNAIVRAHPPTALGKGPESNDLRFGSMMGTLSGHPTRWRPKPFEKWHIWPALKNTSKNVTALPITVPWVDPMTTAISVLAVHSPARLVVRLIAPRNGTPLGPPPVDHNRDTSNPIQATGFRQVWTG